MAWLLGAELAVFTVFHLLAYRFYKAEAASGGHAAKLNRLIPAFLWLIDRLQLWRRAAPWAIRLHHLHIALYGTHSSMLEAKLAMARTGLYGCLAVVCCTFLALLSDGSWELIAIGLLVAGVTPLLQLRQLNERLRRRRQRMLLELPETVNQLLLLANAGETVQQALQTIVERGSADMDRPLLRELKIAVAECRMNVSLAKALDDFQKRCGLQEATVFVSIVLLNYRRGGDDLVVALRTFTRELWEKRKALARTLGEEASSKLVFPMVLVFLVVLIVIASPAVIMMNAN
ncbi:type II secretion system F family protein [Gordoniibacillus kamchatkensis]|uniref:type II secretion system F family protein n=1 Tax=Gordoniibacillus kamchatkensis TaxID=1590651 RepID=UPI0006972307|nr:type II secretion system F family protein [Paenibacillus sp. VKM B-2647]